MRKRGASSVSQGTALFAISRLRLCERSATISACNEQKTCGELRKEHHGQSVTLAGWIDSVRDHSGVLFINLRDRYGLTQIVFLQETHEALSETVRTLHPEDVVQITGTVGLRPEGILHILME